ncbi:MAG: retropepsin-like domain-containing protein [Acidobacteriota bacterium]|nr:retropepsin-like domain-containing protein [Acidobacteriota bacterium]
MPYELEFEKLVNYDSGKSGITVSVELRLGLESVTFEAKIDTGASFCIFAREYGEQLGIRIEEGFLRYFNTTTGSFRAFSHGVTLRTEGFEFGSQVFFAADENFQTNVLGRHGWLDRVIIAINDYDGKLYLSRYESE